jgi:hypothetical protein
MSVADAAFLAGREWLLRTRILMANPEQPDVVLNHEVAIRATAENRADWTAEFWRQFPAPPDVFHEQVLGGRIKASLAFPFRPTVSMRDKYRGHSVLKLSRMAENMRGSAPPADIAEAVELYIRDKARLDEQRRLAWKALLERLPAAPPGYRWELDDREMPHWGRQSEHPWERAQREYVHFRLAALAR